MNEFEKMISGRLYNASDAKLGVYHMERMALCQRLNQTLITDQAAIEHLKEELIPSAKGNDLGIFLPFYCEYGSNIHVGRECFINYNCTFLDDAPITLGDGVMTWSTPNQLQLALIVGSAQVQRLSVGSRLARAASWRPGLW
nr:maltose acetyltransferase domain-containing protein [Limosilactobacillus mucosae]